MPRACGSAEQWDWWLANPLPFGGMIPCQTEVSAGGLGAGAHLLYHLQGLLVGVVLGLLHTENLGEAAFPHQSWTVGTTDGTAACKCQYQCLRCTSGSVGRLASRNALANASPALSKKSLDWAVSVVRNPWPPQGWSVTRSQAFTSFNQSSPTTLCQTIH